MPEVFIDGSHIHVLSISGVKVLTSLVSVNPQYANEHQTIVLDCLEHSDSSIRSKVMLLNCRSLLRHVISFVCRRWNSYIAWLSPIMLGLSAKSSCPTLRTPLISITNHFFCTKLPILFKGVLTSFLLIYCILFISFYSSQVCW
jgi:hypothetical protein